MTPPSSVMTATTAGFSRRSPVARARRALALGVLLLAVAGRGAVSAAEAIPNSDCLLCHEDKTLAKTNANGSVKFLFVDEAKFAKSVHKTNACVGCHADITSKHPDDEVPAKPANCVGCHPALKEHERAATEYATSVHGASRA